METPLQPSARLKPMGKMLKISLMLGSVCALFYGAAGLLFGFCGGLVAVSAVAILWPDWFA